MSVVTPGTIRIERIEWGDGPIGRAARLSVERRLLQFIEDPQSEPIRLFDPAVRAHSVSGDWYGEHAGKWLVAASLAARRTNSELLAGRVRDVADYLCGTQEADGYLGTYAPVAPCRMTHPDAHEVRSWDPWNHAWMMLGLMAAGRQEAATRIGELILRVCAHDAEDLLAIGNHNGLSSAVVIEPLAQLSRTTGDPRFAEGAMRILAAMERRGLPILTGPSRDVDVSELGTGKAYQICWILNGLVALGRDETIQAAIGWWRNIAEHHLTPLGGPWGGIATHKEVFNPLGFFSPNGMTETCSTASWMALCRSLHAVDSEPGYLKQWETSLYNALLGAMDQDGENWCYFTFPNGRRNNTYQWACCKSSGALALEQALASAISSQDGVLQIDLLEPMSVEAEIDGRPVTVTVENIGVEQYRLTSDAACRINLAGLSYTIERGRSVDTDASAPLELQYQSDTVDHHGQEIVRAEYFCVRRGRYVYSTGLVDGYRKHETYRLSNLFPTADFSVDAELAEDGIPAIRYEFAGRPAVTFRPYHQAGGRHDGAWRTTWQEVAWQ